MIQKQTLWLDETIGMEGFGGFIDVAWEGVCDDAGDSLRGLCWSTINSDAVHNKEAEITWFTFTVSRLTFPFLLLLPVL